MIDRPVLIATCDFTRCLCPECKRLDREHPGEGYQLALLPYVVSLPKARTSALHTSPRVGHRRIHIGLDA